MKSASTAAPLPPTDAPPARVPLDYHLPGELIAQVPAPERDGSRLMVVERGVGPSCHARFGEIGAHLPPGALLVANDSRVFPARLRARKRESGGAVELLVVGFEGATAATAMANASKPLREGQRLVIDGVEPGATVVGVLGAGRVLLEFSSDAREVLAAVGEIPLPPYIERPSGPTADDRERYQTVYAHDPGSVAAPTAGLHFTSELLAELARKDFGFATVTLHVGPGTFVPVRGDLDGHRMEAERFEISPATAALLRQAKAEGRCVVAVGTTTVRALESAASGSGEIEAASGQASLFIRPGHRFRVVDALITNFHLPGSTLLALVMALAGIDATRRAYAAAVEARYRFYSYGDAMLIR